MNSKNSMVVVLTIAAVMLVGGLVAVIGVSNVNAHCNGFPQFGDCKFGRGGNGAPGGDGGIGGVVNGDNNENSGNGGDGGDGGNGGNADIQ